MSRRLIVSFVFVLLASAAVYSPFLRHEFIWDDYVQISDNPAVTAGVPLARWFTDRATTSTRTDYNTRIWRPLRGVALRAIWRFSQGSPAQRATYFRVTNLLLYLLGGLLVLALCRRFVADEPCAFIGASLWVLWPVHAEDVMYPSALGDLLSFDLQLVGLLFAFRAVEGRMRDVGLALVAFSLAIFVKEMAITTLLILPAYLVSERRPLLWRPRTILLVALHGIVGVAYLGARTKILGRVGQDPVLMVDTIRAVRDAPWLLLSYLRLAVQPLGHAPDYGMHGPSLTAALVDVMVGVPLLVLASLRSYRGVRFGVWLYVLAFVPVLHFVPLWTLMADRFLLLPSVGLALALAAGLSYLPTLARRGAFGLALLYGVICLAATLLEARRFTDDESLWAFAVAEVPDSGLARHNLGIELLHHGEFEPALPQLLRAEELGRRDPRLYAHLAGAFEGLGRYDEALRAVNIAVKLDPTLAAAYLQRALLETRSSDLDAADRDLVLAEQNRALPRQVNRERAGLAVARGQFRDAYDRYVVLAKEVGDPSLWQHAAVCAGKLGLDEERRAAAKACLVGSPGRPDCVALAQ